MLSGLLRLIAVLASATVVLGFAMFAVDEMNAGSQTQQQAIDQGMNGHNTVEVPPAPTPQDEKIRERQHSKAREAIDDANDVLLNPFSQIVSGSKSNWVTHGVPALLALILYGVGLGFIANLLPQAKARSGGDWRVTAS